MKRVQAVECVVGLDWSGRVDAAGQRRHIFAGVWMRDAAGKTAVRLENGRTREEVADWLLALASETPRLTVGIDCCFSFPAWFLREHGCRTVFEFWRKVNEGQGELWLARDFPGAVRDERFWGKPHKRPAVFCGEGLRSMYRETDYENKIAQALEGGDPERAAKMRGITPKSPFQIGGSGSVGTGSLRAMPVLQRLHAGGFRIWPFEDAALEAAELKPLLLEIYTRLMTGAVAKSNAEARKVYLAAKKQSDPLYAGLGRKVLQVAAGSEDALDALATTLELARHREEIAGLRATRDKTLRLEGITWRAGAGA